MSERTSQESGRAEHEPTEGQPRRTRREAIAAAGGGVGGLVAGHILARPERASASHIGPVWLGDRNELPANRGKPTTIVGDPRGQSALIVANTATGFATNGVHGISNSGRTGSAGVRGVARASIGAAGSGVHGLSLGGLGGTGVVGEAHESGSSTGVRGDSRPGVGVQGRSEQSVGVWGRTESPNSFGLLAENTNVGGVALRARGNLEAGSPAGIPFSPSFRADAADPVDGETAILVRRNVGGVVGGPPGTFAFQRVLVGPRGSGGGGTGPNGFRALRVPNVP